MTIGMDCEISKSLLDETSCGSGDDVGVLAAPETLRNKVIGDYLHDLRTPLVALRGYAKMLQEERVGPLNSLQQNYIQIVAENSQRLVRVLNELSQVASMEPMNFEKVDLQGLLESILASRRVGQAIRSTTLERAPEVARLYVWGDPRQLAEAFAEILQRVSEATPVEKEVRIALFPLGDRIRVRVSNDELRGDEVIPSDERKARFSRSSARTSFDRVGGLSIAEATIILHGGQFVHGSDSGDGAAIELVLPAYAIAVTNEKESS